jgi:hypothetical protein
MAFSTYNFAICLQSEHIRPHSNQNQNIKRQNELRDLACWVCPSISLLIYDGITPVCSLLAFYFTMFHLRTHTPLNHGRMGAMGRHASGSFSASMRSWRAILWQCTKLRPLVDTIHQTYHQTYL